MNFASGKWKGFYEFGAGYPLPYFAGRVQFELILAEADTRITGICTELASEISNDSEARIEGFVEENFISFRKIYAHSDAINEDGTISRELDKENIIYYYGDYDPKADCMFGTWEISNEENGINNEGQFSTASGLWKCERVK